MSCQPLSPSRRPDFLPRRSALGLAIGCAFRRTLASLLMGIWAMAAGSASAAPPSSVLLEALTSTELQSRIQQGSTTVLVPIGGTEQSGPHMALGKHNVRVQALATQIAQRLGHTVVAPVLAYVPQGSIHPPAAHMRWAGTLSIPDSVFEALLDATARSLRQHGFTDIVFLGDHGGYQKSLKKVADALNRSWGRDGGRGRVHALLTYYEAAQAPFNQFLRAQGHTEAEIGIHAGLADTALSLAIDPALVRMDALEAATRAGAAGGVTGDPRRATAALGQVGVQTIVEHSTRALQQALQRKP